MVDDSIVYFSDIIEDYYDTSAYSNSYNFDDDDDDLEDIPSWPLPYLDDSECGKILDDLTDWLSYIFEDDVPESAYTYVIVKRLGL